MLLGSHLFPVNFLCSEWLRQKCSMSCVGEYLDQCVKTYSGNAGWHTRSLTSCFMVTLVSEFWVLVCVTSPGRAGPWRAELLEKSTVEKRWGRAGSIPGGASAGCEGELSGW